MSAPQWDENLQTAHDTIVGVHLDDDDVEFLEDDGYSVAAYQEMFAEAFMQYRNDPNNELTSVERGILRAEYFRLIEAMGYDREDFIWAEWRRWMGYE